MSRWLERIEDIDVLRQAALLLEAENERLAKALADALREALVAQGRDPEGAQLLLLELDQKLEAMRQKLFASSQSEKRDGGSSDGKKKPRTGHGPRPQPELPVEPVVHDLEAADRVCTSCGGELEEWAGQEETSEEIDLVTRRFVLKKHVRKKYRCACGGCVELAPAPAKLTPGGRYSADFAIEVAVGKYLDHLPLERQVRIMEREGLVVDSQTLWDQVERLARLHEATSRRILAHVLGSSVIGADETRWRIMGKDGKPEGGSKWWQMWVAGCSDAVYYAIKDSRSADAAGELLGEYTGVVMCDGYTAYSALQKRGARYELAHCWAHVRREFLSCESAFPVEVKEALERIGQLYELEASCRAGPPGDEERRRLRAERSRPIIDEFRTWMTATAAKAPPTSALRGALEYTAKLWSGLTRFLDDPRIPLDNNASERALRGPVVGRKNHYGSRSRRGTEVAAVLYTLLESAKLAGLEPKAYLRAATQAALLGRDVPLPHELAAAAAAS